MANKKISELTSLITTVGTEELMVNSGGTSKKILVSDLHKNMTITGTVDGRDLATDGTKLDTIEASADVTDATSVAAAGGVMNSDIGTSVLAPTGDGSSLTGIGTVPSGLISMWSGSVAAIPSGWVLCDGDFGTPNLIGKFIKAAATAGGTGGSNTHTHSNSLSTDSHTLSKTQMPSHTHEIEARDGTPSSNISGWGYSEFNSGENVAASEGSRPSYPTGGNGSHSHSVSGSIESGSTEPEYFALCYIMKT